MRSHRRRTAVLAALGLCFAPLALRADDLAADLEKLLKDGASRFSEALGKQIDETLAQAQKGFADAVGQIVEKHVAGLKKEIADRDRKISDLEARIKRLESQLADAGKKKADWPAENLTRAYLGVGHTDVPDDLAGELEVSDGALVTDVLADGPAASAGLRKGDVIVSINGKAVTSENLSTAIRNFKPGARVEIAYIRGGDRAEAGASLVDKNEFWARRVEKPQPIVLGVLVAEPGLVVKEVEDGFTGSVAGLKVDDRLVKINGASVKTLEEVASALGRVRSGAELELGVQRGDESLALRVIGSHEKGKAELVSSRKVEEKPAEKQEEKKEVVEPEKKEQPEPAEKRAYLGIDVVEDPDGPAVVASVLPDTTASAFGLKEGDVFKKLNGQDVGTTSALIAAVGKLSPGDRISLVVSRGGEDVKLRHVLVGAPGQKIEPPRKPGSLGIVAELTEDGKVLVKSLIEGGAAGAAGLEAGDVIVEANGKAIKSFEDLEGVLQGLYAGDDVTFKVRRDDSEENVNVTLAEKAN